MGRDVEGERRRCLQEAYDAVKARGGNTSHLAGLLGIEEGMERKVVPFPDVDPEPPLEHKAADPMPEAAVPEPPEPPRRGPGRPRGRASTTRH